MKQTVKVGISTLEQKMTYAQAMAYGKRNMPADLRRAGFVCVIYRATADINGWNGLRINYGK